LRALIDKVEQVALNAVDDGDISGMSKTRRWILLILAAVGVLLIAAVGLGIWFKQFASKVEPPMTALNIYTDTLIQRDYQSAYIITSPAFRAATRYSELAGYQSKLTKEMGNLKSAKQRHWQVDEENGIAIAHIQADLQYEQGVVTFQFVLRKEDGIWRVLSSQSSDGTVLGQH
jgi:hypothetical protein